MYNKGGIQMKNGLKRFDDIFIELINGKMRHRHLDIFMYKVTNLGGAIYTSLIIFMLLLFGNEKIKFTGLEALVTLTISQSIVYILKKILSRERPYKIIEHLNTFGIDMKDYSFPSGHTTASFSIATTIALNIPRLSVYVFIIAMIISISRIYLGVHYPTDVAAGIFLGLGTALMVHFYLLEYIRGFAEVVGMK